MPLTASSVVRRGPRVPFTTLDDETLAIDAERGFLFSLNETGRFVWDAISEPTTVADVCERMVRAYAVDEATCRPAVIALIERLDAAGLVEIVAGP